MWGGAAEVFEEGHWGRSPHCPPQPPGIDKLTEKSQVSEDGTLRFLESGSPSRARAEDSPATEVGPPVLRASGLALLTLPRGWLPFTDPSLLIGHGLALAFSLLIHQPYQGWAGFTPSAQSAPGPKPVTWLAGSGRARGPGQRVLGWAIPSFGRGPPSPQHGPGQRLPCPPGPRLWEGLFKDLDGLPSTPPSIPSPPSLTFVPSRGPGAQPGLAGAAATVQCIGQWAVEPGHVEVRVGQMA